MTKSLQQLTALYSSLDVSYNQAMSGPYSDLSVRDEDCEIIAGLKDGKITGFWRPMVACGADRALQEQIDRLWAISQDWYYMDFLIGGELSVVSRFLLEKGYQARPVYTQVIDLTIPVHILHGDLRKSYKSLVAKYEHVEYGTIDDYRIVHEKYGGHKRDDRTWQIQAEMIERQDAFVLTDGPDAAVLIYENDCTAYYAGGRSSPEKNTHALIWQAIMRSKAKVFEMGEQVCCVGQKMMDGKPATEKNMNISHFKAGMGGRTVTRLIVEKEVC